MGNRNKEHIDLILRAIDGDRSAWERITSGDCNFFVPMADLEEEEQSRVTAFFSKVDTDAALDKVDPRWAEEHPQQVEMLRLLAERLKTGRSNAAPAYLLPENERS